MRYVSLHHHSTFSYLDGYQLPEAHVRRATEIGMQALAMTEHGNVSSHDKLEVAAKKEGVKAIYGCELYCGRVDEETRTQRKNHLTVLASTPEGYRNLLRVVSQGWSDFYYEPTVSGEVLVQRKAGLIILSGCTGSLLSTSLVGGKNVDPAQASYARGKSVAARFRRHFGDSYYLEVQAFPELENVCALNKMIARISDELNIPLVATGDVHYTLPTENEMQQILHNVRAGHRQTLEDMARSWGYHVPLSPPTSDQNIYKRLRGTGLSHRHALAAIANTEVIAQRCNVDLPRLPPLRYPLPPGYSSASQLVRAWLKEGWFFRGFNRLRGAELKRYRDRIEYELGIIEEKDYVDYFLEVADLVKFAKNRGIPVGPARGSAAASLVCYLLRITEVNPLLFPSLVFERFIDITRTDLPDIDLDFDSERRGEIRDYAVAKYGPEQVNNIGTFTYYKSKNSLDDVARVYKIPQFKVDIVKNLLIERSSGDLRASATIEDTVEQFDEARKVVEEFPQLRKAMDLEGNIKGMGVHAAGLVISNGPITDVCAVYERKVKDVLTQVVSLDKWDAERRGLVKIDILGLSTMTMIKYALEMLNMPLDDLYDILLDDERVIDAFRKNDVTGIFQFDGRAMRSVNAELQPDSFKEICDVNALARPGPLHNNASAEYIDIKKGRKEPERLHPLYDRIAEDTNFQIVYQEQILRIVREIGGFDWTHAAYIRKIISKKLGEQEFRRQWERFWEGARDRGVPEPTAAKIWGLCITAGSYAFNAAHCVSYGMLAYWTMWLKVYHPTEFYVASLRAYDPKKHQLPLLKDADRHDIRAEPPDPSVAGVSWTASQGRLVAGFSQIPGLGEKTGQKIVDFRDNAPQLGEKFTWDDITMIRGIGNKKRDTCVAFCEQEDPFEINKLRDRIEGVRRQLRKLRLPMTTHTSLEIPYSRSNSDVEVIWLGVIQHRNLRDLFEVNFSRTGQQLDPFEVKNPELREWVIMRGVDDEELVTITVDRWKYPRFKKAIWGIKLDSDLVLIRGIKRGYQSRRAIYVKQMWVIDPDGANEEEEEQFLELV